MNKCGECTACCHVLGIKELVKDAYVSCEHLCDGCSIYDSRPAECRGYECHWLQEMALSEDFRPDRCGVILEQSITTVGIAIVVREVVDGAVDIQSNRDYIMIEAEKIKAFVYIMRSGGGPESRSVLIPEWIDEKTVNAINNVVFKAGHRYGSVD